MLTSFGREENALPVIRKSVEGKDVSALGAFAADKTVTFEVTVPRRLGASAVVLRLSPDGGPSKDLALSFSGSDAGDDVYRYSLDLSSLCGEEKRGLFYYEFLFLRGMDTLFSDTFNNLDFELSVHSAGKFRLLVYRPGFSVPRWLGDGMMLHVFVDRFYRGEGPTAYREDSVLDPDWGNGIPQYPEKRGDAFPNNVFFGGNLWGIVEKLDDILAEGFTVLYLSPIFEAASNHKYDTGDYRKIDRGFGGEEAFLKLLSETKKRGMHVILDGVFNHTGDDSLYFDRYGRYGRTGAYQNPESPFAKWYTFKEYPDEYDSWWGIRILPRLNSADPDCRHYFTAKDGIGAHYVEKGTSGWRLDVADELSDEFLDEFRASVKAKDPDAVILGEVWENAADKTAYGHRRRYLQGGQLDSVMNYPFRTSLLDFFRYRDATVFSDTLKEIYASYPREVSDSLMNLLGTHDTERILTVLGEMDEDGQDGTDELTNAELAVKRLTSEKREKGIRLLTMAAALQFTVYGFPSVFYGDNVGMEGYNDPFCRRPYPWGKEDKTVLALYRRLSEIRRGHTVYAHGEFEVVLCEEGLFGFKRFDENETVYTVVNRSPNEKRLPDFTGYDDLLTEKTFDGTLPADTVVILRGAAEHR